MKQHIKIVIDQKIPFIKGALERSARVVYLPGDKITDVSVRDADALIVRTRTRCDKALLEHSSVKFIATATIGYDHIDTEWCAAAGIRWTNAPGCNASSVEQYIVSALLYMAEMQGFDPRDKCLGVIGAGNVGSKVARAAKALGFEVLLNDPPRAAAEGEAGFVALDTLLERSDIVSMHVPLNREGVYRTESMADAGFFEKIRRGAIFINTSRGEVVDEDHLREAIRKARVSDAVLDVYRNEPRVDRDLLGRLFLATPHIAGYSADGKANGTKMSVQAVSRHFGLGLDNWEPVNVPAPEQSEIFVDASGEDLLSVVGGVYAQTYSVQEDHDRFMADPGAFETLRGNYRLRREPSAYSVRLFSDDGQYRRVFEGLGFDVIGDSCY